ncbi:hypothetical protein [Ornithinimicrobium kibberense]|uniref:hypothetical protein n=1 Tax=Ornithinimicrobium kibberense TaxID=282060 RepID=UPI0036175799
MTTRPSWAGTSSRTRTGTNRATVSAPVVHPVSDYGVHPRHPGQCAGRGRTRVSGSQSDDGPVHHLCSASAAGLPGPAERRPWGSW